MFSRCAAGCLQPAEDMGSPSRADVIASSRDSRGAEAFLTRPPDIRGPANLLEGPDEAALELIWPLSAP
jgi:hypothetical protein